MSTLKSLMKCIFLIFSCFSAFCLNKYSKWCEIDVQPKVLEVTQKCFNYIKSFWTLFNKFLNTLKYFTILFATKKKFFFLMSTLKSLMKCIFLLFSCFSAFSLNKCSKWCEIDTQPKVLEITQKCSAKILNVCEHFKTFQYGFWRLWEHFLSSRVW